MDCFFGYGDINSSNSFLKTVQNPINEILKKFPKIIFPNF